MDVGFHWLLRPSCCSTHHCHGGVNSSDESHASLECVSCSHWSPIILDSKGFVSPNVLCWGVHQPKCMRTRGNMEVVGFHEKHGILHWNPTKTREEHSGKWVFTSVKASKPFEDRNLLVACGHLSARPSPVSVLEGYHKHSNIMQDQNKGIYRLQVFLVQLAFCTPELQIRSQMRTCLCAHFQAFIREVPGVINGSQ